MGTHTCALSIQPHSLYEINIQNHKIHSLDPVDISGLHYNQTTESLLRQESDTFSSCKNR